MATLKVTNIKNESFAGDQLYLKSDGKIGIGTTNPDAPLTIHNSADPEIRFGYSASQDHRIAWDSSKVYIHADPDNANGSSALGLAVDGTTRLYINDSGNIGIGTTSPANEFVISKSGSGANCKLEIAQSGGGGGTSEILFSDSVSGRGRIFFNHGSNPEVLNLEAAGTIGLSVTNAGKIGIGTVAPDVTLHVNSGSTNTVALFESTDTEATIQLKDTTGSSYIKARNDFRFENSTGELVRIDSGGDVLIGLTSTPSGNGTNLWVSDGTVARLGVEKTGTGACKTTIGAGSDRAFNIYNETADHEIIRGETDGDVKITTGNLIIGTAGKGIDFSATAGSGNSELLSDYEHGNWVPTSVQGGWTVSNTYSKYVKIGNLVHLQMYIGLSGTGNGSALEFGGMPFAVGGNGYSVGTVDFGEGGIKGTYMRTMSGASTLSFLYPSENTSTNRVNLAANQVGDSYVIATISYVIDGT